MCLLVFDMASPQSFARVQWWQHKVREYNDKVSFILVGCKEDLVDLQGSEEEIPPAASRDKMSSANRDKGLLLPLNVPRRWAESAGTPFFTTSAKRGGQGITFLFYSVAEKCIRVARERQLVAQQQLAKSSGTGGLGTAFGNPNSGRDEDDEVHEHRDQNASFRVSLAGVGGEIDDWMEKAKKGQCCTG